MPASWNGQADHELAIGTVPGLRFDEEFFEVKTGSKVQFTFNNNDDMLHNLVITIPGETDNVAESAMDLGIREAGNELRT